MTIDPTTPLGKVRLRIGDFSDLPILPDSVINATLADCSYNVPRAASICAQYILAALSAKTHRKLSQIETWGAEQFKNYVDFLKMTVLNPAFMPSLPVPYVSDSMSDTHPLIEFVEDWNNGYADR